MTGRAYARSYGRGNLKGATRANDPGRPCACKTRPTARPTAAGSGGGGWDALIVALERVHPGQEPRHVAYPPGVHFGAPLQGCSAYDAGDHWHYVTFGMSELYVPDDLERVHPSVSGWGFELTMRVPRRADEEEAPGWPFIVLAGIAQQARTKGEPFLVDDRLDRGAPVTGYPDDATAPPTGLTAYAFALDQQLQVTHTP
ncbi:hypothetical protein GCM10025875_20120 [Litorihabitans aurantiacus]|uniref:Suppressor of fused-like domain-containing protein n=1 Tax=Litorihabitans aurantiacus TaxID=1930061 RepID=A0AA38CUB9_9MICO|nr:hypothetical protein GCM10025875_20120 [Litorihabitans aurantiacus]